MFVLFLSLFQHYNAPPFRQTGSDGVDFLVTDFLAPIFKFSRKADPGQSRGKPDASAE